MTVAEVSRLLYMEQKILEACIESFVHTGILLKENQRFLYAPGPNATTAIEEIARLYGERRTAVINFIYANSQIK
ncbi:MAG: hypothetical protein K2W95_29345 [Candidatus Obscuribacterales bacterium]|nr:hypothetical protein [Candidatus Obscuribacterales bacterium]